MTGEPQGEAWSRSVQQKYNFWYWGSLDTYDCYCSDQEVTPVATPIQTRPSLVGCWSLLKSTYTCRWSYVRTADDKRSENLAASFQGSRPCPVSCWWEWVVGISDVASCQGQFIAVWGPKQTHPLFHFSYRCSTPTPQCVRELSTKIEILVYVCNGFLLYPMNTLNPPFCPY